MQLPLHKLERLRKTVSAIGGEQDNLLHNHATRERVIYRYPLVQYKSIFGRLSILGIGEEGGRSLEQLMTKEDFSAIFSHDGMLSLEKENLTLLLSDRLQFRYRLLNWMPFNDDNLHKFRQTQALVARTALLESCLTGHLLKFCSAIGWLLPPRSLRVELNALHAVPGKTVHGNRFHEVFDASFSANIQLPPHIGLGKAVSHGFGVVMV